MTKSGSEKKKRKHSQAADVAAPAPAAATAVPAPGPAAVGDEQRSPKRVKFVEQAPPQPKPAPANPDAISLLTQQCAIDVTGVASGQQELWLIQLPNANDMRKLQDVGTFDVQFGVDPRAATFKDANGNEYTLVRETSHMAHQFMAVCPAPPVVPNQGLAKVAHITRRLTLVHGASHAPSKVASEPVLGEDEEDALRRLDVSLQGMAGVEQQAAATRQLEEARMNGELDEDDVAGSSDDLSDQNDDPMVGMDDDEEDGSDDTRLLAGGMRGRPSGLPAAAAVAAGTPQKRSGAAATPLQAAPSAAVTPAPASATAAAAPASAADGQHSRKKDKQKAKADEASAEKKAEKDKKRDRDTAGAAAAAATPLAVVATPAAAAVLPPSAGHAPSSVAKGATVGGDAAKKAKKEKKGKKEKKEKKDKKRKRESDSDSDS